MGWYANEAIRLLREKWSTPTQLAEELFAILSGTEPMVTNSPLQLQTPPGIPPITINNPGDGTPLIQIQTPWGQKIPVLNAPKVTRPPLGLPPFPTVPSGSGAQSSSFPGQIVSGSGNSYQVSIYPDGLSKPATLVTVTQLQIDPKASLPAGTWAIVIQAGGQFFMQVPVWL